ncbi:MULTISPECIES: AlpA family phage regulatory protein [Morganellaceae]|uniref:AlpA family phage regulatory protein n=1 Tax=Morganellaceae TaxID=1903414 RepID=UPI0015EB5835|nr:MULTISPECIES: AlpA family phage regulatory protein [Morganellaceae]ELR5139429.1 AlpA family phage regulatory protein [Providencia rettgeri]ELT5686112.1 AlpA family phage regulatory protein [Providencia rettgeri]MDM3560797.1 AlpA family phage regulatory protein [Proteus vulgaris]QLQ92415.1 AlpA family phage regulatory protein [Providencia rettgeri]QXX83477.1 AlpA family phage regulatory protein [Providencia sp. R33]
MSKMIKICSMAEVMLILDVRSRNSVYNLERKAGFPPRIRIGIRRIGYDLNAVQEWLNTRTVK